MVSEEESISKFTDEKWIHNIFKSLQEQREICRFCDVILKVCGEEIFVHSNVLAAASPYFASFLGTLQDLPRAFSQKLPQIIEIHIEGSNESKIGYGLAVRKLVDFMYTSCIQITPSVITQVSEIAKIMQLDTIIEICEKFRNVQSKKIITVSGNCGELSTPTTVDKKNVSHMKLDDHTYGIHDVGVSINPESSVEKEKEEINNDLRTQAQICNPSASSVDSQNEDTKPPRNDDLDRTPSSVEASDINSEQMLVESMGRLLNEEERDTDMITTDEVPAAIAKKEEITDPADILTEPQPLISAPSEQAAVSVDTKSEPAEGVVIVTLKSEESSYSDSVEGHPVKGASDQCSGAVRSSLRTRIGKKTTKDHSYHKKKVKVKSRVATTITNNNNNTSNNINEQTQNNDSATEITDVVKVYICEECLYSTYNSNHYKHHKKTHRYSKYSCDKCDYKASWLKALNDHKRGHLHAELQCSYCTYKATTSEDLTEHLLRHSGELPYFCSACDMKFKTRTQLNQHIPKHSNERPFVCTKCFVGFKWKHALKNHMVVHSENKDYLCDICGYATAHRSQLKNHRLIHTGETLKCSIEGCTFQALKQLNL